jgi:BirA family transcriptional regulator, biotin operon repressor / biotin---[acetyl-CoA-carboxylase] ligase
MAAFHPFNWIIFKGSFPLTRNFSNCLNPNERMILSNMEKKSAIARLIFLPQVDSTNNYAMNLLKHGWKSNHTVVWTGEQLSGRGQRGNSWFSSPGNNLTFSMIAFLSQLPAWQSFAISMASALAVDEFVSKHCSNVSIKWPNDIYIGNRKVAGILIENTLERDIVRASVIGIGINLNQTDFPVDLPNPVSVRQCTGKDLDIRQSLDEIYTRMMHWFSGFDPGKINQLREAYIKHLLGFGRPQIFRDEKGNFSATIDGVEESGELILKDDSGHQRKYAFKEVELVLPKDTE